MHLEVTNEGKELLCKKGFDPVFGARPLRRVIQNLVEDPMAEGLLQGKYKTGDTVIVDADGEEVTLTVKATPEQETPELATTPA